MPDSGTCVFGGDEVAPIGAEPPLDLGDSLLLEVRLGAEDGADAEGDDEPLLLEEAEELEELGLGAGLLEALL